MGSTYVPLAQASFSTATYPNLQPLLSDGDDVVSRSGTIASGLGIHKRGEILKIVPATGVITVPAAAADCNCILVDDVDATSATKAAVVYLSGKFKADAVIWPGVLAHADCADALRNYGILIESVIFTDGTLVKSVPHSVEEQNARAVVEHNKSEQATRSAEPPVEPKEKPKADSPWAYLTAEEREKNPELAQMPTAKELTDAAGGGEGGTQPDVPGVTIEPTSAEISAFGGTGAITVTITSPGASGTWIAEPEASATWLSFSPTTPQSANGTVNYTAASNTGPARVGHCYINGKTFTVNQAGA